MNNITSDVKYIDSFDIDDWEIETDTGWEDLSCISKTIPYEVFELKTASGISLKCADTHILFDDEFNEIFAKDSVGHFIQTKNGLSEVISFSSLGYEENMFDVTVENDNHRFYSNDVLSHNSTTVASYMLHYVLFNPNKLCAILANKVDSAIEILGRIQESYENLPFWLKMGVIDWNKKSVTFENGSRIIAAATSSSAIRGKSANLILLDEYAFVPKNIADQFYRSVFPVISSGTTTKLVVVSTPFGMNHFYKLWNEAVQGINGFVYHRVFWNQIPGRDEAWKKSTITKMGSIEAFKQEFEGEFIGSAGTLISGEKLKVLTYMPPIFEDPDGLKLYKPVSREAKYMLSVDTSEGLGLDFHSIQIINISEYPYEQVGVYRNPYLDPLLLPDIIFALANKFNEAYVIFELNSMGAQVAEILYSDLEYENILTVTSSGRKGQVLGGGFGGERSQMGLKMSKASKRVGTSSLKTLIENDQLIINDFDTYSELTTFVRNKGSYEAEEGCNDDTVMSLVVFAWVITQKYFKEDMEQDIRMNINRSAVDHYDDKLVPFGIIDDGIDEEYKTSQRTPLTYDTEFVSSSFFDS
jgi:hypothetical protein